MHLSWGQQVTPEIHSQAFEDIYFWNRILSSVYAIIQAQHFLIYKYSQQWKEKQNNHIYLVYSFNIRVQ